MEGEMLTHIRDIHRKAIVDALVVSYRKNLETIKIDSGKQINRDIIVDVIGKLQRLMFPGYFGNTKITEGFIEYHAGQMVEDVSYILRKQIARALMHRQTCKPESEDAAWILADDIVFKFLSTLPAVREMLALDVDAFFEGDPAAYSKNEIISSYPGLFAITVNRLAHELYQLDVPLIPRVMTEHAHSLTGIDIHPGATIGHHFFIDHGTGIVVGQTTFIGNYVKIYQGVTLGALSTRDGRLLHNVKRHPTIEDNVTIYSGASILGGQTIIGEGAIIGSNVFVTKSVGPGVRVSIKVDDIKYKSEECANCPEREKEEAEGFWDWCI
jgi:serine O-acetyltransferase